MPFRWRRPNIGSDRRLAEMHRSRITFSSAIAARAARDSDEEEEPGEVIESAPPLQVGEEREVNAFLKKKLLKPGSGWETPVFDDEVTVQYEGLLLDGTYSDSSKDKGQLLTYRLGQVVDICKDRGIIKKILSSGDDIQTGDLDEVKVKYELRLLDGTVVAKTPEGGLQFYVSQEHLCPALPRVLKTMKKGEKATVIVQPQYAFGENGREAENGFPAIPTNSELIIDLELLSLNPVLDVTGDLKVLKKILKVGEGIRKPNDGEVVLVRYTAMLEDGKIFERKGFDEIPFEFVIDEEQVISGLDRAVATMLRGELSQVTIKPEYGFRNEVKQVDMLVPAGSTLLYEVELVDFTKEKETCEMWP